VTHQGAEFDAAGGRIGPTIRRTNIVDWYWGSRQTRATRTPIVLYTKMEAD